ncbi:MAG TPA: HAMP domain-containing sensor histidine kinase [Gemmatimonadales bacterium]|nr:HAMP domain-containing sensor histidine kinase [Gemmatimonadales bacterium]
MSFRARLFAAFLLAAALPLGLLAFGVRREMTRRLAADDDRRVAAVVAQVRADLAGRGAAVAERLAALRARLEDDNRLRLAVTGDAAERRYLLDWAGDAMRLTGLSVLRLQDSAGRILSSGHFRNEYDQVAPIPAALAPAAAAGVLLRVRGLERPVLVLARSDSTRIAGRALALTGGVPLDSAGLAGSGESADLAVALRLPDDSAADSPDSGAVAAALPLAFVDLAAEPPRTGTARLVVSRAPGVAAALRRSVDAWALAALALSGAAAVAAAAWLAARVSRPVRDLAAKTVALDLDRLDADFATDRSDELGNLSRVLGEMTDRIRQSTVRLREAERRAAFGDVARQVNHDVKNGLTPIRHVLRHLAQVARDDPAALAAVFAERKATLEASVEYLETLARNYARLSPRLDASASDLNEVVRRVAQDAGPAAPVELVLADGLPRTHADAVVLRRIVENLAANALEALDGRPGGRVTLATEPAGGPAQPAVRLVVTDTGRGMSRDELARAFDDFHTTKPGGTGLGLSIVRRLVQDLGGTLRVETEPGAGSRFSVELPGAPHEPRSA